MLFCEGVTLSLCSAWHNPLLHFAHVNSDDLRVVTARNTLCADPHPRQARLGRPHPRSCTILPCISRASPNTPTHGSQSQRSRPARHTSISLAAVSDCGGRASTGRRRSKKDAACCLKYFAGPTGMPMCWRSLRVSWQKAGPLMPCCANASRNV